jgi:hypothetical protein
MIKLINGQPTVNDFTAPASTAFDFNDVVTRNSSGVLAKATASTPRSELLGLIQTVIASTDSDYASAKSVPVLEFTDDVEFLADVDTGTLVSTMVGKLFDLADEDGIDVTSEGQKCVEIVRYVSATQARVKFITSGDRMRLVSYQQTVSVSEFTDGGSTAGTLALGITIPAGAVFARSLVTGIVGFAGDTTAVVTIGDGSDVDRYNTGTPDVFATLPAGVDVGAPSGTVFHSAVKTPTLTVTTGSDFGLAVTEGNGAMVVTLFYYVAS